MIMVLPPVMTIGSRSPLALIDSVELLVGHQAVGFGGRVRPQRLDFLVHHDTGPMLTPPWRALASPTARRNTLSAKPARAAAFLSSCLSCSFSCTATMNGRLRFTAIMRH
jgi:hypothetical protein